jgi:CheY-like chemotaxis protein
MEQVKAMLSALRSNYLRDLPSQLDELEQLVLELERTGFETEGSRELYRRIHSLKGSGGTYSLHVLSDICHPFEDLISNLLEHSDLFNNGFVEIALAYLDLLRKVQATYRDGQEPGSEIKLALQELRRQASLSLHSALVVDVSDVVVGMLRDILKSSHFRVEVLNDGYAALGRILSEPFDVVITGLEIKRLNGLALISAVQRAGTRVGKTKTILLTSTQLKLGADKPDFILKKDAELRKNLNQALAEIVSI